MSQRLDGERLVGEVRAFLRGELRERRTWLRRAWLGRRLAALVVERAILLRMHGHARAADDARRVLVDEILRALEEVQALDAFACGKVAEELPDPVDDTRPITFALWPGADRDGTAEAYVRWLSGDKRPQVRPTRTPRRPPRTTERE